MTPKALEDCPQLPDGLDFYLTAFSELDHDRPVGLTSAASIPWSAIERWGTLHYLDVDGIADLEFLIRKMERAMAEYAAEQQPTNEGTA